MLYDGWNIVLSSTFEINGIGLIICTISKNIYEPIMLVETSAGADYDNPQIVYNRGSVAGRVAANGRSFVPPAPFQSIQIDMDGEIHSLEQIAYCAVLRAFKAQSDALTWVCCATCYSVVFSNFLSMTFGEMVSHLARFHCFLIWLFPGERRPYNRIAKGTQGVR